MRWIYSAMLAALFLVGVSGNATAQQASQTQADTSTDILDTMPSDGSMTPEMWFYAQEYRRYQSPQEGVRRKAEFRAAQRRNRLATRRWFGLSNLRPTANPIPYYGTYSPAWIGSTNDPFSWSGQGQPYVTYHVSRRGQ